MDRPDRVLNPADDLTLDPDPGDLRLDLLEVEGGGCMLPNASGLEISGRAAAVVSRDGLWPWIKCFNDLRRGSLSLEVLTVEKEEVEVELEVEGWRE